MKNKHQFPFGIGQSENQTGQSGIFIKLNDGQGQQHVFAIRPGSPNNAASMNATTIITNINISNTSSLTNIFTGSSTQGDKNEDEGRGNFWRSRL